MKLVFGLLSDAHGNLEAYELGVEILRSRGASELFFLGDAVGYLPGAAVVEALARDGVLTVRGNHEEMLLEGSLTNEQDSVYQLLRTRSEMGSELLGWVEEWPVTRSIELAEGGIRMVHGHLKDPINGYVYPDSPLIDLDLGSPTTVFMGATHRPFVREIGSTTYVNVGSCGIPRDHGNLGSVCLFDTASRGASIIRYDIAAATESALLRCGPVHETVLETFGRRGSYMGEMA